MYNLLEAVKVVKCHNGAGAGTTLQTTSAVDTSGYDGVAFIADLGTVTDASVLTLTPFSVSTNTTTGGSSVANATNAAFTAATSSNTIMQCDVIKPANRYVYATLGRTTQNAVLNTIIAVLYRARKLPASQPTSVIASTIGGAI